MMGKLLPVPGGSMPNIMSDILSTEQMEEYVSKFQGQLPTEKVGADQEEVDPELLELDRYHQNLE
jgi:hypothetical protein